MTHCLRVGVGGPVGSGKTALLKQLCLALRDYYDIAPARVGRALPNRIY